MLYNSKYLGNFLNLNKIIFFFVFVFFFVYFTEYNMPLTNASKQRRYWQKRDSHPDRRAEHLAKGK